MNFSCTISVLCESFLLFYGIFPYNNFQFTSRNGDTKEHSVTTPDSANNLATSATRRMFSWRSSSENPRSENPMKKKGLKICFY